MIFTQTRGQIRSYFELFDGGYLSLLWIRLFGSIRERGDKSPHFKSGAQIYRKWMRRVKHHRGSGSGGASEFRAYPPRQMWVADAGVQPTSRVVVPSCCFLSLSSPREEREIQTAYTPSVVCRLCLKHPPTALGGITLVLIVACISARRIWRAQPISQLDYGIESGV